MESNLILNDFLKFFIIISNDSLKKADAIILLEGDGLNRVNHAVKLYKEEISQLIVFSGGVDDYSYGSFPFSIVKPFLLESGVNENHLIHEPESMNTVDQANNVIKMAKIFGWTKIILVASHYHQYRAYLTFLKKVIDDGINLQLINSPEKNLLWFEQSDWGSRISLLEKEFNKIIVYKKDLASFEQALKYQEWKEKQV